MTKWNMFTLTCLAFNKNSQKNLRIQARWGIAQRRAHGEPFDKDKYEGAQPRASQIHADIVAGNCHYCSRNPNQTMAI